MSPPTLKIMDEKLTVSYSELTGSPSMSMIFVLNKYKSMIYCHDMRMILT